MGRIRKLAALTKYFAFTTFTENSQHINTRYFAELVSLVKKGTDPLSTGIINEGLMQLEKTSRKVFEILKDLTLLHKERYKLEVRKIALSSLKLEHDAVITHQDDTIRKIKQKMSESTGERVFYPELVIEILKEDFSAEGNSLRDEILKKLEISEVKNQNQTVEKNFKTIILDGARMVIGIGFQLDDAIHKLEENQALLDSLDNSFMAKVKRALREMFGKKGEHVIHEVELLDPVTSARKNESIDFTVFCAEVSKRSQALVAMVPKNSASYKRVEGSSEDLIYKFLSKSLEELQAFHRKLSALDEFFGQAMTETDLKNRVKGIKSELGSIKNAIIKANQKRHEYIAQKEELEQMKRLGIRDA